MGSNVLQDLQRLLLATFGTGCEKVCAVMSCLSVWQRRLALSAISAALSSTGEALGRNFNRLYHWTSRIDFGNDTNLTLVDRLTKQAHFVLTRSTADAEGVADLYVQNVMRHHGLSRSLVSDRDPRFTSGVYRNIFTKLGVNLKFSTSHHPQLMARQSGFTGPLSRYLGLQLITVFQTGKSNCQSVNSCITIWCKLRHARPCFSGVMAIIPCLLQTCHCRIHVNLRRLEIS